MDPLSEVGDDDLARAFHKRYYERFGWARNQFLGHQIQQFPGDVLVYQQLLHETRPAAIVQTGVGCGGSVLFFASMLDLLGLPPEALVVGIDVDINAEAQRLSHPRIRLIRGSSTDPAVVAQVAAWVPAQGALVSLDSDHHYGHVLEELDIYKRFVPSGGWLVVEDTNVNGRPVLPSFGPGPLEAVQQFIEKHTDFVQDDEVWQRNLFSFHQGGWLRRQ